MASRVVLDPGHGGTERRGNSSSDGVRFTGGVLEQQVNFALAQRVSKHLGGAPMTRREHENRSLRERIEVARQSGAEAFVSLHTNESTGHGATDVWVHEGAGQPSIALAERIRAELAPAYGGAVRVARANMAVLHPEHHAPGTAACLVDLSYLAPMRGGRSLADGGLDGVAAAIARGVTAHQGSRAPAGYGRGGWDRALDTASPILSGGPLDMLRTIGDWIQRQVRFRAGVADTTMFPNSAICKLFGTDSSGSTFGGTGFYISPNRILTAGHVALDVSTGARTVSVAVVPGMNGTGVEPFGRFTVNGQANIVPHPQYNNRSGSDFDMAVIKVGTPPPNGLFFDYLDARPASVGQVAICGYAADSVDPNKQHLDVDLIRNVSNNLESVDYNATTEHGTSGAPVFYTLAIEDEQTQTSRVEIGVVGVHVSSQSIRGGASDEALYNRCCRLTDDKLRWIWGL